MEVDMGLDKSPALAHNGPIALVEVSVPNVFFFCNDKKVEVDAESLTGMQIKEATLKVDPTLNLQHDLILQANGPGEDQQIRDGEPVTLTHGHGTGPKHFYTRPPTNFGKA
ncbi:hypothetical protein GCM10028796_04710 [Ramlibacter monticola]|uniref:Multiubiquitin domain-containing protein n=1 Tax=Ramlibacter monticola TaxID=1926872 RepID=A0A937CSI5_9BURK|nr:multiubiquitin domain-containing protein [Ramlibacter monticola]MBL0391246.1 multiubiquitin domain-containing protein [Ramlibacter monticola]